MIVLDASVVVDFVLLIGPHHDTIVRRMGEHARALAAPHLLDAEVGQVLRRFVRAGSLSAARADDAIRDYLAIGITRYPHASLLLRAFDLRDNATVYDGLYLALAEALDATLLTRDVALGTVPGHRARVEVLS